MKKQRVKLLNQMRMEASRKKQDEARVVRQIAQLKKEDRRKEHRIQSLEAEAQRRDTVLKRRADEVCMHLCVYLLSPISLHPSHPPL